jgi:hypothetical protein
VRFALGYIVQKSLALSVSNTPKVSSLGSITQLSTGGEGEGGGGKGEGSIGPPQAQMALVSCKMTGCSPTGSEFQKTISLTPL